MRNGSHCGVQQGRRAAVGVEVDDVVAVSVGEHDEARVALRGADPAGPLGRERRRVFPSRAGGSAAAPALGGSAAVQRHVPPHRRDGARVQIHRVHRVDALDLQRVAEGAEARCGEPFQHAESPGARADSGGRPGRRRGDSGAAADAPAPAPALLLHLVLLLLLLLPPLVPAVVLPTAPRGLRRRPARELGFPASGKDPQAGDAEVAVDDLDRVVKDLVRFLRDRGAALCDDDDLAALVSIGGGGVLGVVGGVLLRRGWGGGGGGGGGSVDDAGRGAPDLFLKREREREKTDDSNGSERVFYSADTLKTDEGVSWFL